MRQFSIKIPKIESNLLQILLKNINFTISKQQITHIRINRKQQKTQKQQKNIGKIYFFYISFPIFFNHFFETKLFHFYKKNKKKLFSQRTQNISKNLVYRLISIYIKHRILLSKKFNRRNRFFMINLNSRRNTFWSVIGTSSQTHPRNRIFIRKLQKNPYKLPTIFLSDRHQMLRLS